MLWIRICQIVFNQENVQLKLLPKLQRDHIFLTPYSRMNVRLVVQVLSKSEANILRNYYPCKTHKTTEFFEIMNNGFDIFNVRNSVKGIKTKNCFLQPFSRDTDERSEWLRYTFRPYFTNWDLSIKNQGYLSELEKEKMFIAWQTYEGIKISICSLFEVVKFLLENGASFVWTERFN